MSVYDDYFHTPLTLLFIVDFHMLPTLLFGLCFIQINQKMDQNNNKQMCQQVLGHFLHHQKLHKTIYVNNLIGVTGAVFLNLGLIYPGSGVICDFKKGNGNQLQYKTFSNIKSNFLQINFLYFNRTTNIILQIFSNRNREKLCKMIWKIYFCESVAKFHDRAPDQLILTLAKDLH